MKYVLLILTGLLLISSNIFAQFEITIDAERDAYYNTLTGPDDGYIYIPPEAYISSFPEQPFDNYDLSAFFWLAWDEQYLYCYSEVHDDLVLVNNATLYENDAVEFKMDPDPYMLTTTGVAAIRLSALGEDDAGEPAGVDNLIGGVELDGPFTPVAGEDYARKLTDEGYNLEFRIPWEAILRETKFVTVEIESIFGLAINVMDNDLSSRTKVIQWSAGMADAVYMNPQLHGTVTFLADHKLKMEPINSAGGPAPLSDPNWYIPPATGVSIKNISNTLSEFNLTQNYPNPFNPSTCINYTINSRQTVKLLVYDALGNEVAQLVNEVKPAGSYTAVFDGSSLASGIYFCSLRAGEEVATMKMMLMK